MPPRQQLPSPPAESANHDTPQTTAHDATPVAGDHDHDTDPEDNGDGENAPDQVVTTIQGVDITSANLEALETLLEGIDEAPSVADLGEVRDLLTKIKLIFERQVNANNNSPRARGSATRRQRAADTGENQSRKRARDPWQPLKNITVLEVPEAILIHIATFGDSARALLDSPEGIKCEIPIDSQLGSEARRREHFSIVLNYTLDLEASKSMLNFRWCFQMLFFYDLVRWIHPDGAGRIGKRILQKVDLFLERYMPDTLDRELVRGRLTEWCKLGKRLDFLCQQFGPGCIFYLSNVFSPDFINHKMTMSGQSYDEVVLHLKNLRLKEIADQTDMNRRGTELRALLAGMFAHGSFEQ